MPLGGLYFDSVQHCDNFADPMDSFTKAPHVWLGQTSIEIPNISRLNTRGCLKPPTMRLTASRADVHRMWPHAGEEGARGALASYWPGAGPRRLLLATGRSVARARGRGWENHTIGKAWLDQVHFLVECIFARKVSWCGLQWRNHWSCIVPTTSISIHIFCFT